MRRTRIAFLAGLSALGFSCGEAKRDRDAAGTAGQPGSGSAGAGSSGGGASSTAGVQGLGGDTGGAAGAADGGAPSMKQVPLRALAVSSSILHTCVLLEDHSIKCFGVN